MQLSEDRNERIQQSLDRATVWYVFTTVPQKELLVEYILAALGYAAVVPVEWRWRRVCARDKLKRQVPYVMASRYVFIGFEQQPIPWHALFRTRLLRGVVGIGGEPIALTPATMRGLFASSGAAAIARSLALNKGVRAGEDALITEGPFKGHVVRVDGIDRRRAKVMLDLFSSAQSIEVSLDALEAA